MSGVLPQGLHQTTAVVGENGVDFKGCGPLKGLMAFSISFSGLGILG